LAVPRVRARLARETGAEATASGGDAVEAARDEWLFTAANGSAWSGCKLAVDGTWPRGPHVWFLSEHRLRVGAEQGQAEAWAKARGLGLAMHGAAATGDGPLHTSSGTAVAIKGGAVGLV